MAGAECIESRSDLALVICDINMPRMSGLEMLERVSSAIFDSNLPIVMLTTEGRPQLVKQAKALGAKGWMIKPFKPKLLVAAAKKLVGAD